MQKYVFEMFIYATLQRKCKRDKSCKDKIKCRLEVGTGGYIYFVHTCKKASYVTRTIRTKNHGISKLYILFTPVIGYIHSSFFFSETYTT